MSFPSVRHRTHFIRGALPMRWTVRVAWGIGEAVLKADWVERLNSTCFFVRSAKSLIRFARELLSPSSAAPFTPKSVRHGAKIRADHQKVGQ